MLGTDDGFPVLINQSAYTFTRSTLFSLELISNTLQPPELRQPKEFVMIKENLMTIIPNSPLHHKKHSRHQDESKI